MERREFIETLGAVAAATTADPRGVGPHAMPPGVGGEPHEWRGHFPALNQRVNGRPLIYFDTAATSLRPRQVIDAVSAFNQTDNANPGGALHTLARRASEHYEGARRTVARFVNANDPGEIVFTRGTTDGLNLVAAAWGGANLRRGDQILIGRAEHASNMVPWQLVARRTGAEVRYFHLDSDGLPSLADVEVRLTQRTRVVAFSHVSNVLGLINPAKHLCDLARAPGRIVVVDAAQSAPHISIDVQDLGCDFLAFSSHKMLGPMGVGVLWGRRHLLDGMPPYQGGSNMAHDVDVTAMALSEGALKFGAGTPNVSGAVGLAAAIRFLETIGFDALRSHERAIARRMFAGLGRLRGLRVLGAPSADRIAVFTFTMDGWQPSDILRFLDERGIAVRAGDLASLPLLKHYGVTRAARASCYLYSTEAEVDRFVEALAELAAAPR